jgi:diguanylate cyclase (GGDEF)-like protein
MVGGLDTQNQKRPKKIVVSAIVYIVAGAGIAVSLTAIWGALYGESLFAAGSQNGSHLTLVVFLGAVTVLTIALPVEFWERHRAEETEGFLGAFDPRIELENRRELFDSLEMEIKRSTRTQRPFAFLRIRINDMNRINNEHGHLVADRAQCRLAQVLQAHCRELDTVVRYGGEFAIVIPEAGPETVRRVTARIRERFAGGRELPLVTISIGAAMFGEDGKSIDTLLQAAEHELYDAKEIVSPQTSKCA